MANRIIHRLDPAASVIAALGGPARVSSITGKDISRVYRWMAPKDVGGTGGLIPQPEAAKLLRHAKDNGIAVTAADFFGEAA